MPLSERHLIASAIEPMPRPRLTVVRQADKPLEGRTVRRMFVAIVLWMVFAAAFGHMLFELDRL